MLFIIGSYIGLFFVIIWKIYTSLYENIKETKQKKTLAIGSNSLWTLNNILERFNTIKEKNETIIITDDQIVSRDDLRRQIHEACDKLKISSKTIKPSGINGAFMIVSPKSPFVTSLFTHDELALFVRYSKLPIDKKLLSYKKIFMYYMHVLDSFHKKPNSISPYDMYDYFIDLKYNTNYDNKSVFGYINDVETRIINHIKNKDAYKNFICEKKLDITNSTISVNPYKIGKEEWKISVDMISANFTVLKLLSKEIVDCKESWKDFVRQFTDSEFIINSKVFRQELFGKLNINRIHNKEKELLESIIEPLKNAGIIIDGHINTDEIIISTTKENCFKDRETIKKILDPNIWKIDIIRIMPLVDEPKSAFYPFVKDTFICMEDNKFKFYTEFVCLPKFYILQAIKFWQGGKIEKYDLALCDEFGDLYYAKKSKFH